MHINKSQVSSYKFQVEKGYEILNQVQNDKIGFTIYSLLLNIMSPSIFTVPTCDWRSHNSNAIGSCNLILVTGICPCLSAKLVLYLIDISNIIIYNQNLNFGAWASGKPRVFGARNRRFESYRPSEIII